MPQKNKLSEVSRAIVMPGCRFTPTALVITKVTKPVLQRAGQYLQTVDACRAWWWGDFLNAYCQWKLAEERSRMRGAKLKVDDTDSNERQYVHYTEEYSAAIGVEDGTMHHWRAVAGFYEVCSRLQTLSWSHHQEAMHGSGANLEVAIAWLKRAQKEGWSKTQLRAAIRAEAQLPLNTEPPAPFNYAEVVAFKRWASAAKKRLANMDTREATTLRQDLQPAVDLAHELDERLTGKNCPVKISRVPPEGPQRR